MILSILGYLADAAILGAYFWMTRWPQRAIWFHWANAVGCIPLVGIEIVTHAWPVLPLTATFGVLGAYGVRRQRPRTSIAPATYATDLHEETP